MGADRTLCLGADQRLLAGLLGGLPVRLQVIGQCHAAARVLQFAAVIEQRTGPTPHPPHWDGA